jgi:hypothetical protein
MPTKNCNRQQKPIGQTLFLGASVASFNTSAGWGGQPSQLTVNLIEDDFAYSCASDYQTNANPPKDAMYNQFAATNSNPFDSGFAPNHFHTCGGDDYIDCFVDKTTGAQATASGPTPTPIQNRIYPGKVYYKLDPTLGLVSDYWKKPDPGFFGYRTRIKTDGTYDSAGENSHPNYKYDLIDTPVYFKMGDFTFGGLVQSWSRGINSSGRTFTVTVNSPQSILNSCYVIVDKFAGSLFGKSTPQSAANIFGSPKNYVGSAGIDYNFSDIYRGVLPNVFNVYGFLESFGIDNFGVARNNENGMSANKILDALSVLTSLDTNSQFLLDTTISLAGTGSDWCIKRAFSPFGRIVARCMQREDYQPNSGANNNLYGPITNGFNSFGVVNPFSLQAVSTASRNEPQRCQFVLDLQDLIYADPARTIRRLPDDVRISGPIITIGELINQIAEQTGQDTFVEMVPIVTGGVLYHVIKVKTISRLKQPSTNLIENTIKQLQCNDYALSSITTGKEKNEVASRAMLIGGQQQRLYQVKSYRLAYSQNNFVYNPNTREFVNYYNLQDAPPTNNSVPAHSPTNQYGFGKIRFPNFNSTRNVKLNQRIGTVNGLTDKYVDIISDEDNVQKAVSQDFSANDPVWKTTELKDSIPDTKYGNYEPSFKSSHNPINDPPGGGRWFPLFMDNICPFFGFIHDSNLNIQTNDQNQSATDYRKIRPVWFDTWTGQIAVVIRISELPTLNVSLKRANLSEQNEDEFFLPYIDTVSDPEADTVFDNSGPVMSYDPIEFFVLTESEMRAALAGFDNFLVYSLSKTYKPDLIELVRRAYYMQTKKHLKTNLGVSEAEAKKLAFQETDWYWKLLGTNIGGDSLYPTPIFPDKNDGSQYIQEKALQDLKMIHKFVGEVAKYYGKKYMVKAHKLSSYRDETFTRVAFPTNIGYGYVLSGAGSLTYNYVPTNDGAWEEYGNIIDDGIVVGGTEWYAITDDAGKIKPLLGYNNNKNYDYIRANKCKAAAKQTSDDFNKAGAPNNGYFSFNSWLTLFEHKTSSCTDSFVFPSIDTTNLGSTDYVVVDQMYAPSNNIQDTLMDAGINNVTIAPLTITTQVKSYDAWGREIKESGNSITRSKVYVTTNVDEGFVYLDPVNLKNPRILIDAPGINLSLSSEQHAKDPNRAVLPNVAVEDLLIYMKTHMDSSWDYDWIRYMLNYVCPMSFDDQDNPYYLGLYTISSNSTANNVEFAPKAAHPFFAGIPIKSNQYVYGPWTNYPYAKWGDIFYDMTNVTQSNPNTYPITCTTGSHVISANEAKNALDNLITNTSIEVRDDLVPWNYGGMHQLDQVVFQELESMINYQAVIETAQIDMPNLPLFNLGGVFSTNNIDLAYAPGTVMYRYVDKKTTNSTGPVDLSYIPGAANANPLTDNSVDVDYTIVSISGSGANYTTDGPIISNIQSTVGQNGITTTYSFRTYTRKLGLFNRESIERTKKMALMDMQRNKKMSQMGQEVQNVANVQRKFLLEERLNKSQFGSADLSSKLFGWSPGMVLVGQANPLIDEPVRGPKYIEDFSYYSNAVGLNTKPSTPTSWQLKYGSDPGDSSSDKDPSTRLTTNASATTLKNAGRLSCTVQLYQRKEVEGQIQTDYGMQSLMSLDGLLSPISFYPTHKNSTFSFSLFDTNSCPVCHGTKLKTIKVAQYDYTGPKTLTEIKVVCDSCGPPKAKLNASINTENADIPINAITLNPVVVPFGEFKNSNTQNYVGAHPNKAHADISAQSPGLGGQTRRFIDRMRHCIEIVGRGSVPPNKAKYALETSRNLTAYSNHPNGVPSNNLDYYHKDEMLKYLRTKAGDTQSNMLYEMNQRFFGLRGPLTLHSWGYDEEGYPVPNAADEPYGFDTYGRPKRFKLKQTVSNTTKKFKSLAFGEMFALTLPATEIYAKTFNDQNLPALANGGDTSVYTVKIEDDYSVDGGFDPDGASLTNGYKGSIISKTQKFNNGKWSEKIKLNEFYLNWAERPDLWKVGPIDLHWDSNRRVWTGGGGGGEEQTPPYIVTNSNDIDSLDEFLNKKSTKNVPYRMIYATLEEDLIKQPDFDETFATRAFIDDVEFSKEPLLAGYRRLIYIKDKCGYCAPNGSKLLCRYNRFTGFYEPVTKPSVSAKGKIMNNTTAVLDAAYIQGKRSTGIPSLSVTFDNPLGFTTPANAIGIFMFLNGKWTLSAIKN